MLRKERSRSRDDRDREEESQAATEQAGAPTTTTSNQATGSGAVGVTPEERTWRNEEMADLNSVANMAVMERDSEVVATPPEDGLVSRISEPSNSTNSKNHSQPKTYSRWAPSSYKMELFHPYK